MRPARVIGSQAGPAVGVVSGWADSPAAASRIFFAARVSSGETRCRAIHAVSWAGATERARSRGETCSGTKYQS